MRWITTGVINWIPTCVLDSVQSSLGKDGRINVYHFRFSGEIDSANFGPRQRSVREGWGSNMSFEYTLSSLILVLWLFSSLSLYHPRFHFHTLTVFKERTGLFVISTKTRKRTRVYTQKNILSQNLFSRRFSQIVLGGERYRLVRVID